MKHILVERIHGKYNNVSMSQHDNTNLGENLFYVDRPSQAEEARENGIKG